MSRLRTCMLPICVSMGGPKRISVGTLLCSVLSRTPQPLFPWLRRICQTNPAKRSQTNESAKARQALACRLVRRRRFVRLAFMAGGHHGQGAVSPTLTGMRRTNARSAYHVGRDSALADLWSGLKGLRLRRKISVFGWASRIKYWPIFRN